MKRFFFFLKENSPLLSVGLVIFYFAFLGFHFISSWDDATTLQSEIEYSINADDLDHSPARQHQNFRIRSSGHSFSRISIYSIISLTVKIITIRIADGMLTKQNLSLFLHLSSHWDYSTLFRVFRI